MLRARREQPKKKGKVSDLLTMFGGKRGVRQQPGPPRPRPVGAEEVTSDSSAA